MQPEDSFQHDEDHNDDIPVGRLLSRREAMTMIGGVSVIVGGGLTGFALNYAEQGPTSTPTGTATALPSCIAKPDKTEGPYFLDDQLERSDIRTDPTTGDVCEGVLLNLIFRVTDISTNACTPLPNAIVDIWHCDALGVYSGFNDNSANFSTVNQQFLRGYQRTDAVGHAEFLTIYPGWYSGRTVHIHFKIRVNPDSEEGYEFTSQLFFDDELTDEVFTNAPYSQKGIRNTRNTNDNIYGADGEQLLLALTETDEGFTATFDIGLDLTDMEVGASDSGFMGGGMMGGNPPPLGGGGGMGGRRGGQMPPPTPTPSS